MITSNHTIEEIFGPDPDEVMTKRKRSALETQCAAIVRRFKQVYIGNRQDQ